MMNNMGVELFELPWVNAITTFLAGLAGRCLLLDW